MFIMKFYLNIFEGISLNKTKYVLHVYLKMLLYRWCIYFFSQYVNNLLQNHYRSIIDAIKINPVLYSFEGNENENETIGCYFKSNQEKSTPVDNIQFNIVLKRRLKKSLFVAV